MTVPPAFVRSLNVDVPEKVLILRSIGFIPGSSRATNTRAEPHAKGKSLRF
jgi:hypothetical protein